MTEPPIFSIVIVSYNTAALTLACLESLIAANGTKEIHVVDNASTDGSPSLIKESFPDVYLAANRTNRGFAEKKLMKVFKNFSSAKLALIFRYLSRSAGVINFFSAFFISL